MSAASVVQIHHETHVAEARREARRIAAAAGFAQVDAEALATAAVELASNLLMHARGGALTFDVLEEPSRRGVQLVARDGGPGIANVEQALTDGFSTGGGLGLGLPSVKRFADELEIQSSPGGTTVRLIKWARPGA